MSKDGYQKEPYYLLKQLVDAYYEENKEMIDETLGYDYEDGYYQPTELDQMLWICSEVFKSNKYMPSKYLDAAYRHFLKEPYADKEELEVFRALILRDLFQLILYGDK